MIWDEFQQKLAKDVIYFCQLQSLENEKRRENSGKIRYYLIFFSAVKDINGGKVWTNF